MEVHPPNGGIHSWKDFWVHLGTITIGLLIAIGLEQSVEWMHRVHERHVLQSDLREEAQRNMSIIKEDVRLEDNAAWMEQAATAADTAASKSNGGKIMLVLAAAPCYAGTLNSPKAKYFAPSESVWEAARESGTTALIPLAEARVYARLAHNMDLASKARDAVAAACDDVASEQQRLSVIGHDAGTRAWTMTPQQAEKLAETASHAGIDIKALVFRLAVVRVCEEAILDEALDSDKIMEMIGKVEDDYLDKEKGGATKP